MPLHQEEMMGEKRYLGEGWTVKYAVPVINIEGETSA